MSGAKTGPLQSALTRWLQGAGKKAGMAGLRSVAAEVVLETTGGITYGLDGTPERVDTGEYRDGWLTAAKQAGVAAPKYPRPRARDSQGRFTGAGGGAMGRGRGRVEGEPVLRIVMENQVEHAGFVEYGTTTMRAGNHLARAKQAVKPKAPGLIRAEIAKSWAKKS